MPRATGRFPDPRATPHRFAKPDTRAGHSPESPFPLPSPTCPGAVSGMPGKRSCAPLPRNQPTAAIPDRPDKRLRLPPVKPQWKTGKSDPELLRMQDMQPASSSTRIPYGPFRRAGQALSILRPSFRFGARFFPPVQKPFPRPFQAVLQPLLRDFFNIPRRFSGKRARSRRIAGQVQAKRGQQTEKTAGWPHETGMSSALRNFPAFFRPTASSILAAL